jgi:hypothetical protein
VIKDKTKSFFTLTPEHHLKAATLDQALKFGIQNDSILYHSSLEGRGLPESRQSKSGPYTSNLSITSEQA